MIDLNNFLGLVSILLYSLFCCNNFYFAQNKNYYNCISYLHGTGNADVDYIQDGDHYRSGYIHYDTFFTDKMRWDESLKSLIATENIQIIYAASTTSSDPNYGAMFSCYVNNVKVSHTYMGYAVELHTGDQFKAVINRDTNYSYTATGEIQIAVIPR